MKYKDMNLTENELNQKSIIKGKELKKCSECGEQTVYIDFCTESYICSEECMRKQNEWLNKKMQLMIENEEEEKNEN